MGLIGQKSRDRNNSMQLGEGCQIRYKTWMSYLEAEMFGALRPLKRVNCPFDDKLQYEEE